jgi:cation:H+ antiporter
MWFNVFLFVAGLAALVIGADVLVRGASKLALSFGISPLVVGLTIVALGTSAPEMAVSTGAVLNGQTDIAVGNVVGSCIFNVLGCIGLSGLAAGATGLVLAPSVMAVDIWVMLAVTLACLPIFLSGREIARWEGGVFLAYYVAYVTYLILDSQQHGALPLMSQVMMGFVVPLTVVALVASLIRQPSTPA